GSRDGADPAQKGPHQGEGKQKVVSQRVGRVGRASTVDNGPGSHPGVRHVERRIVIADDQRGAFGRQILEPAHRGGEIGRERPDLRNLLLDVLGLPVLRTPCVLLLEPAGQYPKRADRMCHCTVLSTALLTDRRWRWAI